MNEIDTVKDCYNNGVEAEWNRLHNHIVEFEINKRYIYRYLERGDKVLDIGGGPGRYSLDMAEKGCNVTLFDLSQNNIDFAMAKALEKGLSIKALSGDARYVDALVAGPFDAILLMGPLYHLPHEDDRVKTVEAALRLLKPGGYLIAAFISSYAAVWDYLTRSPEAILVDSERKFFDLVVNDESFSGMSFAQSHFIRPSDTTKFMARFPLQKLHLIGSESILATRELELMREPREVFSAWLDFAERICEREEFLGMAHHFLYIGKKLGA